MGLSTTVSAIEARARRAAKRGANRKPVKRVIRHVQPPQAHASTAAHQYRLEQARRIIEHYGKSPTESLTVPIYDRKSGRVCGWGKITL
jgi:hypothetical protein